MNRRLTPPPAPIQRLLERAQRGDADAQRELGMRYLEGNGVQLDTYEAAKWIRQSAEQGDADAQLQMGVCCEEGTGVLKMVSEAVRWYELSAHQGNAEAQFRLGWCLLNRREVAGSETVAVHWLKKAAKQDHSGAQCELGMLGERDKKLQEAVAWYEEAAEQGNVDALFRLGCLCIDGDLWGEDPMVKAVECFRKAAKKGHMDAQYRLGICYEEGTGVREANVKKAVEWYEKSAEQGNVDAQFRLGRCYLNGGNGLEPDPFKAVDYLRSAAEQSHAAAQHELGRCHETGVGVKKRQLGKAIDLYRRAHLNGHADALTRLLEIANNGKLDAQFVAAECFSNAEDPRAIIWYRKAADRRHAAAQCKVGEHLEGTKPRESFEWFNKAAEQGNTHAQFKVGYCYETGKGVARNVKKAVEWYRKAAADGHLHAQNQLGKCYEGGLGESMDINRAVECYRKVVEEDGDRSSVDRELVKDAFQRLLEIAQLPGGNSEAQIIIADCYENGRGVERDLEQAIHWLRSAENLGNASAQRRLGELYMNRRGVQQDERVSIEYFRRAAEQGDDLAQFHLGVCYEEGKGARVDVDEAVVWYLASAKQGNKKSMSRLRRLNENVINRAFHLDASLERALDEKNQLIASANRLKATLKLALGDPFHVDNDGNTSLMTALRDLDADVLSDPEIAGVFCDLFDRSPWHAVNRKGCSLAEMILDNRVPAVIRDHARSAMERALDDSSADHAHRSAAARALGRDDLFLSSGTSFFEIPFGKLPVFPGNPVDTPSVDSIVQITEEALRRLPLEPFGQLQSLVDMLHMVNKTEMVGICRLEQLLPDLERNLIAIRETKPRLSIHGIPQSSNDADNLERIQKLHESLQQQADDIETFRVKVVDLLPPLESILFPNIEGETRCDRISSAQLNDMLVFLRRHHGEIAWHQQTVFRACNLFEHAIRNYSACLQSLRGDLNIHHSFMRFFVAYLTNRCTTARKQVEEITSIQSQVASRRQAIEQNRSLLRELRDLLEILDASSQRMRQLEADQAMHQGSLLKFLKKKEDVEANLSEENRGNVREIVATIAKLRSLIVIINQRLETERQTQQKRARAEELKSQIMINLQESFRN